MTWRNEARAAWERLSGGRDPLDALSDVSTLRRQLDLAELEAVREARRARRSWTEIATRLGMTRQSAWEKWRDLDEEQATESTIEAVTAAAVDDLAAEYLRAGEIAREEGRQVAGGFPVEVPDVVGLTWQEARFRLVEHRLHPVAADSGLRRLLRPDSTAYVVTDQKPVAGETLPPHERVTLWLTEGPGDAGDRAPVTPSPPPRGRRGALDEQTGESIP